MIPPAKVSKKLLKEREAIEKEMDGHESGSLSDNLNSQQYSTLNVL